MVILGIETSCDETAAAVIKGVSPAKPVKILSSVVASSEEMHKATGGIVPEVAAREQVRSIVPVIDKAIHDSRFMIHDIDAIAVTIGPGLIGSLLVGIETSKTLAYIWGKPLIPVNHLVAHLYGNWISGNSKSQAPNSKQTQNPKSKIQKEEVPEFPAIGLVVSGGHTDLVLMEGYGKLKWLGGTRDDAAGECFDKCARILGLPYPGGPVISAEAEKWKMENLPRPPIRRVNRQAGEKLKIKLPRPLINSDDYDFSFSGLKTALRRAALAQGKLDDRVVSSLAYELQEAIVDVLVAKVIKAVEEFKPRSVLLGGGVAANSRLREELDSRFKNKDSRIKLFIPPPELCTDNAVYIAVAAFYNYLPASWNKIGVDPGLEIVPA